MEKKTLRYIVEHTFFPSELYKSPENMVGALAQKKGELIWKMFDVIADGEKMENPYKPEDFGVNLYRMTEEWFLIQIDMPKPEIQPQCSRIFVVFQDGFQEIYYFTVERGGQDEHFLCKWNSEGSHENYGIISEDEREQIGKIASLLK